MLASAYLWETRDGPYETRSDHWPIFRFETSEGCPNATDDGGAQGIPGLSDRVCRTGVGESWSGGLARLRQGASEGAQLQNVQTDDG